MTGLVIRQIRDDDIESVHDLAERFFQFAHQRSTYLTPEALRYLVSSPGVDASTDTLLVERNGHPVAAAVVTANPPYSETGAALVVDPTLDAPDMRPVMELITAGFSAALAPRIASPGAASDPWQHFMMPRSVPVAGSVLGDHRWAYRLMALLSTIAAVWCCWGWLGACGFSPGARSLGALVADGRVRELVIGKVDGEPVGSWARREALLAAGFVPGYRGYALRAAAPAERSYPRPTPVRPIR